jgi:hypothetical protein
MSDQPRAAIALWIAALLTLVYLLTFSGVLTSIDELAMYASTESLVQTGRLNTPQVTFARLHNPVGAIELGQSLAAAPLYALAQRWGRVNNIHAVLLLNVMVTALSGAALCLLALRLGYGRGAACLAALGYGLASTAWPYARAFYREPLVALLWVGSALALEEWLRARKGWALGLLALLLGLAAVVKISAAVALPVALLVLALAEPAAHRRRTALALGLGAVAALGLGMVAFQARFGRWPDLSAYTMRYPLGAALWRGYALLLSPAKGLLLYSPVLLATLPGWPELWRRQRGMALLALGLSLAVLVLYGANDAWYGGLVWGPRFLVPLLPLLLLPLAGAWSAGGRLWRGVMVALVALSLLLQLPVVSAMWNEAVGQLDPVVTPNAPWGDLRAWRQAPPLYQALRWRSDWLELQWWHRLADGSWQRDLPLAGALAALLLAVVALGVWLRNAAPRRQRLAAWGAVGLALLGCAMLLARSGRDTRDFPGLALSDARQIAALVNAAPQQPYTLVSVSNELYIYYWLGLLKGRFVHHWLSPAAEQGFEAVLETTAPGSERLWLVLDRAHLQPGHYPHAVEYWLNARAYSLRGQWVGSWEVFEYLLPGAPLAQQPVQATWENGIALVSYAQDAQRLRPGEGLRLELAFQSGVAVSADYALFVHAARGDGEVILGRDGAPRYGGAPTSGWRAGEALLERRALAIPAQAAPGRYTLVAGFVDAQGRPVRVSGQNAATSGQHVELGTIEVLPP